MQQPKYKNTQQTAEKQAKTVSIPFNHSLLEQDVSEKFNKKVAEMEQEGYNFHSFIPVSATSKVLIFTK